ncbi:RNA-binding S4 domain-containing protein [Tuberibacillus sp. Marseille-P3662]|uniref:RNA-binding S4 domain-containing protein n=1 Tax=Tuberibacillus sp. Marseille-P3662 TaxID=1965358 RepID=UPI000A1C8E5F|nr:RNA-binding S4 domain-containing protein [Tuberibacillus sp. Marseille-P3662]
MRIDKFLKVSRLVKRRTVAKEMAAQDRLLVNDQPAKAGTNLTLGDEVTIRYGHRVLTVKVQHLQDTVKKESAEDLYAIIREESINA